MSRHSRSDLVRVENELKLNHRPRAMLNDRIPAEIFTRLLTSTAVPLLQWLLETTPEPPGQYLTGVDTAYQKYVNRCATVFFLVLQDRVEASE